LLNVTLGLILIAQHTPLLTLIVSGLIVLLLVQVGLSKRLRRNLRIQRKELVGEVNGQAADVITNYMTVKTFATEEQEVHALDALSEEYRRVYVKDYQWMSLDGTGRLFLMHIVQLLSVAIIASMLMSGTIELGIAVFTIAYLQRLSTQLFVLGEILFGYDKIMLQAAPMTDILTEKAAIVDNSNKKLIVREGAINFNDVTYRYEDAGETAVLSGFSLTIPAGQKVGLVGHSGAGKTTLTKLLLRFDDIDAGAITIDGQDISQVTQKSLRRQISYVPQEPMLFHRTLRENIAYARPDASDTEVIEATKRANAYEFIETLPRGLDTIVGERGVKLSGGQRQRIAIARAILKNAPIIILDEATSALDSESEALVQQSFGELMANRTSIVVAHRLSTIRHMDRIIVMEGGKVIEDGTHAELLALNKTYAKLWKRQSGGFIEE
jgi:ATP-binding cassette subfamily B protein